MDSEKLRRLQIARELMDAFSERTGLCGDDSKAFHRYLWTDAFAVQTFLGLADALNETDYFGRAERLVELVHQKLGHFTVADSRRGWISGLSEIEGKVHPTFGGLRIGKKLRERNSSEAFDERLEWERDGQYFHYNTRWIYSLLTMGKETKNDQYTLWAEELLLVGRKFIARIDGHTRMFWN